MHCFGAPVDKRGKKCLRMFENKHSLSIKQERKVVPTGDSDLDDFTLSYLDSCFDCKLSFIIILCFPTCNFSLEQGDLTDM